MPTTIGDISKPSIDATEETQQSVDAFSKVCSEVLGAVAAQSVVTADATYGTVTKPASEAVSATATAATATGDATKGTVNGTLQESAGTVGAAAGGIIRGSEQTGETHKASENVEIGDCNSVKATAKAAKDHFSLQDLLNAAKRGRKKAIENFNNQEACCPSSIATGTDQHEVLVSQVQGQGQGSAR